MRHQNAHRKLNRTASHRRALLANMACSLIEHEQIRTTVPKAKELRPYVERLVTLGKQGTLAARRRAISRIRQPAAVQKLFGEIAERNRDRAGGCIRILRAGFRHGDNAPMAVIEFVDRNVEARGRGDRERVAAEEAARAAADE